jgi:hypothetical protein
MTTSGATLTELIGVYHADGGPVGEAKYILGKILVSRASNSLWMW